MTEAEWLTCENPAPMLDFLRGRVSERKLRLVVCACCRVHSDLMCSPGAEDAVDAAERHADGLLPMKTVEDLLESVCRELNSSAETGVMVWSELLLHDLLWEDADYWPRFTHSYIFGSTTDLPPPYPDYLRPTIDKHPQYAGCLRCLFGNPCPRPQTPRLRWLSRAIAGVAKLLAGNPALPADVPTNGPDPLRTIPANPAWRTPTVVALASQMYESRDFGAMPILADALQDAGCDSEDVLGHCRGPGPHVRGCWVVDLVLGKV